MLPVDLQLGKQLKLAINVDLYYFTNNGLSGALIYVSNPITAFFPAFCQLVEDKIQRFSHQRNVWGFSEAKPKIC